MGRADPHMVRAQCETIHLQRLKIGASVTVTVRRIRLSISEACPYATLFARGRRTNSPHSRGRLSQSIKMGPWTP